MTGYIAVVVIPETAVLYIARSLWMPEQLNQSHTRSLSSNCMHFTSHVILAVTLEMELLGAILIANFSLLSHDLDLMHLFPCRAKSGYFSEDETYRSQVQYTFLCMYVSYVCMCACTLVLFHFSCPGRREMGYCGRNKWWPKPLT